MANFRRVVVGAGSEITWVGITQRIVKPAGGHPSYDVLLVELQFAGPMAE